MHIALFLPDLNPGGAERVMLALAQRFASWGHQVDLVLARAQGALIDEVPAGIRIIGLLPALPGNRLLAALDACRAWQRYLANHSPEAILSSITGTNLVAALVHSLFRNSPRLVVREARDAAQVRSQLEALAIRALYPRADAIVAVSQGIAQGLTSRLRIPEQKINTIPNPLAADHLHDLAERKAPALLPEATPYILAAGRLVTIKDYPVLLAAFHSLRAKYPDLHLLILGDGPERKNLENHISALGLQGRVHLPGHVANPYPYFRRARLFVLSSKSEGMPNVLLEALVLGVPVVATDCPSGPREILKNGRLGTLCPVGDPEALAKAMATSLAQDGKTKPPLSEFSEYHIDTVASRYLLEFQGKRRSPSNAKIGQS